MISVIFRVCARECDTCAECYYQGASVREYAVINEVGIVNIDFAPTLFLLRKHYMYKHLVEALWNVSVQTTASEEFDSTTINAKIFSYRLHHVVVFDMKD